jgi:hypothetical protein
VKKLLALNNKNNPIDVILLSRNSADTGLRIFNSIEHYGLKIERAAQIMLLMKWQQPIFFLCLPCLP